MQTDRLIIRQILHEDLDDFYEIVGSEKVVLDMVPAVNRAQAQEMIIQRLENARLGKMLSFGGFLKEDKKMIALVDLTIINKDSAGIFCLTNPDYWNQGYGREITSEVIKFAVEKLYISKISGKCNSFNAACTTLLEKVIGMEYVSTEYINGKDYLYFEKVFDKHKMD